MRDRHDDVGAAALEQRDVLGGGLHRVDEPEASAYFRRDLRGREAQPDEPDSEIADIPHDIWNGIADGFSGSSVEDVRHHPLKLRLRHPAHEHVDAEIELVVTERRKVESG